LSELKQPQAGRLTALALLSLVAVFAGQLALVETTEAKGGKKSKRGVVTRTAFGTVAGDDAILSATASCPKRSRAVGGGFAVPAPHSGYSAFVFESQKVGQRGWRASAQMFQAAPFDPITIAVEVYCRRGAPKTGTVTSTVPTVDTGSFHMNGPATSAPCPSSRRLTGGGFSTPPPLTPFGVANIVRRSEPTGNSWTSEVESDNAASSLTSYAYCARRKASPPMSAVAATTPGTNPAPASTAVTATCTGKRTMTGGGFRQTYILTVGGGTFLVHESRRAGKTWTAVADQGGDSTAISFSSVGLCAPKTSKRPKGR
jgi:hypothetical protein